MRNAVAFFRNMAIDLQDIALLDGHPVKYLSRKGLSRFLEMELG